MLAKTSARCCLFSSFRTKDFHRQADKEWECRELQFQVAIEEPVKLLTREKQIFISGLQLTVISIMDDVVDYFVDYSKNPILKKKGAWFNF